MLKGEFFPSELWQEVRSKFAFLEADPQLGRRLFFDNSGGSLRLQAAIDAKMELDLIPDCPERYHERADLLNEIIQKGTDDILRVILGAAGGSLMKKMNIRQLIKRAPAARKKERRMPKLSASKPPSSGPMTPPAVSTPCMTPRQSPILAGGAYRVMIARSIGQSPEAKP